MAIIGRSILLRKFLPRAGVASSGVRASGHTSRAAPSASLQASLLPLLVISFANTDAAFGQLDNLRAFARGEESASGAVAEGVEVSPLAQRQHAIGLPIGFGHDADLGVHKAPLLTRGPFAPPDRTTQPIEAYSCRPSGLAKR